MKLAPEAAAFELLLDFLKRSRGFDFSGYKRTSLMRRIRKRMQMLGIDGFTEYVDYLEVHPDEFASLFNTILINVTSFFRDPPAWSYLETEVIPRILAARKPDDFVRVWCAGASSGQEAYTVAMLLAQAMGDDAYRDRVKIYATDVDDDALGHSRQAVYSEKEVESVPPALLDRFFERAGGSYVFRKDLRRAVIFGRHDLLQDAPISRIDLLVCRNTLMYFNAEAQTRILTHFSFALRDNGFLFLGKSEMLLTHANLFTPVDLKWRVFSKVPRTNHREHLSGGPAPNGEETVTQLATHTRLREAANDVGSVAQLVVDKGGFVVATNQQARLLFGLTSRDVGRPLRDLEVSYRPVELRGLIDQAGGERHPVIVRDAVRHVSPNETQYLDVHVTPLSSEAGTLLGASVTFADVTRNRKLQEELQRSKQELETAYEELQSTNEELETTNEELQSTNEELETTNEELQSTNEELETMNEELQSTNEELQTTNDELRERTDELNDVNTFMESILTSVHVGVIVLDRELRIEVWNRRAEDLWGLRPAEALHQHLLNMDFGLPVEKLKSPLRAILAGESGYYQVTLPAVNRRGKTIQIKVTAAPLLGKAGPTIRGVILLLEEVMSDDMPPPRLSVSHEPA